MKLVQYNLKNGTNSSTRVGFQYGNEILDLSEEFKLNSTIEFIKGGYNLLQKAQRYVVSIVPILFTFFTPLLHISHLNKGCTHQYGM